MNPLSFCPVDMLNAHGIMNPLSFCPNTVWHRERWPWERDQNRHQLTLRVIFYFMECRQIAFQHSWKCLPLLCKHIFETTFFRPILVYPTNFISPPLLLEDSSLHSSIQCGCLILEKAVVFQYYTQLWKIM